MTQKFTFITNNAYLTRNESGIVVRSLGVIDSNGDYNAIERRTQQFIRTYWPDTTDTGTPRYYAEIGRIRESGNNQLLVAPTPASALTGRVDITLQLTRLSSTNESNFLSTWCEDLLFRACMLGAESFEKNTETRAKEDWAALYKDSLEATRTKLAGFFTDHDAMGPMVGPGEAA